MHLTRGRRTRVDQEQETRLETSQFIDYQEPSFRSREEHETEHVQKLLSHVTILERRTVCSRIFGISSLPTRHLAPVLASLLSSFMSVAR